ncbi:MAG: hypothetical protein DHS20C05_17490 [Hyphococcus sp.]|nr:MAG: hypothetical protein DHS20C05_17490 [Marinicaulis sp.]
MKKKKGVSGVRKARLQQQAGHSIRPFGAGSLFPMNPPDACPRAAIRTHEKTVGLIASPCPDCLAS